MREWHDAGAVSTFNRDLDALTIERAPVSEWQGETFGAVYRRVRQFQAGDAAAARSAAERAALAAFPQPLAREGEFLLHLFRRYDRELRWWFIVANDRPAILRKLLFHPHMLPGFNDSGAHLINLAFFDGNLLTLQIAARESLEMVARAVRRLTREPAEFFGVDAGRLDVGAQADLVLLDPEALATYDTDAGRRMVYRDIFEHEQLVNRSDGVVTAVYIAGEAGLGRRRLHPGARPQAPRPRAAGSLSALDGSCGAGAVGRVRGSRSLRVGRRSPSAGSRRHCSYAVGTLPPSPRARSGKARRESCRSSARFTMRGRPGVSESP